MRPVGYYINCDDAVCYEDAPLGFNRGDWYQWEGFDGWEEPIVIHSWDESDQDVHCWLCGEIILKGGGELDTDEDL